MNGDRRPILVPLDGSALAERALPWALMFARRWRAPLLLVRVDEMDEGRAYLERKASALQATDPSLDVNVEVTSGEPALALLELEQQTNARLVALTTHGRTGLARWARGSVAETIVRHGAAPVLIVRPWDHTESEVELERMARSGLRVLVPLDGSELARGILPLVTELATGDSGALILAGVVRPPDEHAIGPYYQPQHVYETRHAMREYLARRRDEARAAGVHATSAMGVERDVAGALVDLASIESADVVALSTHGRGALGRVLYGSVADRVAHDARVPVLLVRPRAAANAQPRGGHETEGALALAG